VIYYLVTVLFIGNETVFWSLPFPSKESCTQTRAQSVMGFNSDRFSCLVLH